jgi:hypothetical protein
MLESLFGFICQLWFRNILLRLGSNVLPFIDFFEFGAFGRGVPFLVLSIMDVTAGLVTHWV